MVIFLFKCTMFMPQHPVYTKLGINKYCIKNQHPGLNALIDLLCILDVLVSTAGKVHVLPELAQSWVHTLMTAATKSCGAGRHCLVYSHFLPRCFRSSSRTLSSVCISHGGNLSSETFSVLELIIKIKHKVCGCACACMSASVPSVLLLHCHRFLSWENIASPNSYFNFTATVYSISRF